MPPGSEDEQLHQLLVRHGLPPVLRHVGAFFAATSSVTVAAVTMAAAREPATSTLAWMFAMLVLHGLVRYWLLDRYLRHLERLAELSTPGASVEHGERGKRRTRKRRPKERGGAAGPQGQPGPLPSRPAELSVAHTTDERIPFGEGE